MKSYFVGRMTPRLSRAAIALSLAVLLVFSNLLPSAHAADGDLDLAFGSGGGVSTDFFARRDEAEAVGLQPDGKILVAGLTQTGDEFATTDFAVARYNPGGSLDSSFGSGGKVVTDFFGSIDEARDLAIQTDGKIVLAGVAISPAGFNIGLARYNLNGSLDLSFGIAGKVNTQVDLGASAFAVAIQPDGKILAAGTVNLANGDTDFLVVRYNFNGSLDLSFGVGGFVKTDFYGISARDFINSLAVQPDGKIVAAGIAEKTNEPFTFDFAVARYDSNGSLDSTFGTGGKVGVEFITDASDQCEAVALQSDGKIVAAGQVVNESLTVVDFALVRFNTNGSLDSTFGSGGKVTTDFFGDSEIARDVAIQPDGKIVAGGGVFNPFTGGDQGLARYNTDGSLDSTFGTGGKATGDFGTSAEDCRAIALQPDGKIVAAGVANGFGLQEIDFLVMRYNVRVFDICIQDDSNGNLLQFNSQTGDYQFLDCRKGLTLTGRGAVRIRSCKIEFSASQPSHTITALANPCTKVGSASVKLLPSGRLLTIADRDMTNNTCACP